MFASGFSWFRLIPAVDKDTLFASLGLTENHAMAGHEVANTTVHLHAWLAAFAVMTLAVLARMGLESAKRRQGMEQYVPSGRFDFVSAAEVFAQGIIGLMGDLLDKRDQRAFFPLIAGLFSYIFFCNIQSIIPGFLPPTDNINTNVGMAMVVFLTFWGVGLSRDAWGFIKHLAGPAALLAWFMLPLELVSLCIRPVSLTIRLTANLYGDHQVFTILSDMIPVGIPSALLALAMMVSVVQAFVFSLLTVIYINLSLPHGDHDEHHDGHGASAH
jgi:F-type H+-transporting ATPase subunit a